MQCIRPFHHAKRSTRSSFRWVSCVLLCTQLNDILHNSQFIDTIKCTQTCRTLSYIGIWPSMRITDMQVHLCFDKSFSLHFWLISDWPSFLHTYDSDKCLVRDFSSVCYKSSVIKWNQKSKPDLVRIHGFILINTSGEQTFYVTV